MTNLANRDRDLRLSRTDADNGDSILSPEYQRMRLHKSIKSVLTDVCVAVGRATGLFTGPTF